jgi:hypothetical protein
MGPQIRKLKKIQPAICNDSSVVVFRQCRLEAYMKRKLNFVHLYYCYASCTFIYVLHDKS